MAGPTTEVLNEDIKDLKFEIREIKSEIKEQNDEIRRDFKMLREEFHQVALGLAELRGEAKVYLGVAKWAGAFIVTTVLTSGVAGIWWASNINAKVDGLEARTEERFKAIDTRFDRLEASIRKVLDQVRTPQSNRAAGGAVTPGE